VSNNVSEGSTILGYRSIHQTYFVELWRVKRFLLHNSALVE